MNFLAHLYLSGNREKIMVGNFIADFVKGKQYAATFEPEVIEGILLHRAIDAFTDTHDIVRKSKDRLRPKYRHYAAVIVDVFYDHILARNWNEYHTKSLLDFSHHSYKVIERHHEMLPDGVKQMLPYMIRGNWLLNYASLQGINQSLSGMARRSRYDSKMDQATRELELYYDDFKIEFDAFFPELKNHVAEILKDKP